MREKLRNNEETKNKTTCRAKVKEEEGEALIKASEDRAENEKLGSKGNEVMSSKNGKGEKDGTRWNISGEGGRW